jgi:hypothetical protein
MASGHASRQRVDRGQSAFLLGGLGWIGALQPDCTTACVDKAQ